MASDVTVEKRDSFAFVAFWVAVGQIAFDFGGISAIMAARGRESAAWTFMLACFLAIAVPWLVSVRRHVREPGVWHGRGYLFGAGLVLALFLVHFAMLLASMFEQH